MISQLTLTVPLTGVILIGCVKANTASGRATVAHLCGYEDDIAQFTEALHAACADLGIKVSEFGDLLTE